MQACMGMHLGPCTFVRNRGVRVSGVQRKGFDCTIIGWVWLKCPLSGVLYNWGRNYCPLYGVAGCPLFRGF